MASVYARGNVLWCRLKSEAGQWVRKPTPFRTGDERSAQRYAAAAQAAIDERRGEGATTGPITVDAFADLWLKTRREKFEATWKAYQKNGTVRVQHRDHANDAGQVRKHVLPYLGTRKLAEVQPKHLADWIHKLRTTTTLSSHSVRNVYGLASAMFRAAAVAGHVEATPAILEKAELGEDEGSAEGAGRYTREQFELIIGADQLPEHARVFAALGGLAGLRLGAIAGLRWGDLDVTATPLWRLTSSSTYNGRPTKTGVASIIPVHPVLAAMLASWRHGWGQMFGRPPTAADPIVPRAPGKGRDAPGTAHTKKTGGDLMDRILAKLEIPPAPMKAHALRSTFISLALEDGADRELIKRITHPPTKKGNDAFDRYDRANYWPRLCPEIMKLSISPKPGGRVIMLGTPRGTGGGESSDGAMLRTTGAGTTTRRRLRNQPRSGPPINPLAGGAGTTTRRLLPEPTPVRTSSPPPRPRFEASLHRNPSTSSPGERDSSAPR